MPNITLHTITLPGDLRWTDEFTWSPVARSAEYSITGALLIEESLKQAGRPITLEAVDEFRGPIWLTRATVKALFDLAAIPGQTYPLTLSDGRSFTVAFREGGIKADPVYHVMAHQDADPYFLTLSLQTV